MEYTRNERYPGLLSPLSRQSRQKFVQNEHREEVASGRNDDSGDNMVQY